MKSNKKVFVMLTQDELQFLATHLPHARKYKDNEEEKNKIIHDWVAENEISFKEVYASLKEKAADLQLNFDELIEAGIKLNSSFHMN